MFTPSDAPPEGAQGPSRPAVAPQRGVVPLSRRCLMLLALWSFAVAQPIFFQMREHAIFLSDLGAVHGTLWTIVLCLGLLLPGIVCGAILLCGRVVRGSERWLFGAALCLLWLLLALQFTRSWPLVAGLPSSVLFAGGLTWLGERSLRVRQFLAACSLGVAIFPAMFVTAGPVRPLAWGRSTPAPSPAQAGRPVPVVMIVFDEFSGTALWTPERQIDARLFPNFAQLANDGVWHRNATSVHGQTGFALPAILSGLYPPPNDPYFAPTTDLFSLLIDQYGYDALVLEPVTRTCRTTRLPEIGAMRPDEFPWREFVGVVGLAYVNQIVPLEIANDRQMPRLPMKWFGVWERTIDSRATRGVARHPWNLGRDVPLGQFLNALTPATAPTLYFLHVVLPHMPYTHDAGGDEYVRRGVMWDFPRPADLGGGGVPGEHFDRWPDDPLLIAQAHWRYLWQVQYADRFIGQVRRRLIEQDLYDQCLLIVLADHGVSFRAGDRRRTTTTSNQLDMMSIPLFVKPPGPRAGRVSDDPVEAIDAFPTILDVLQIPNPPAVDGTSLVAERYRARPSKRFLDAQGLRVLPPDYVQSAARADWPVLSAQVEQHAQQLADPESLTGRRVADFKTGPPSDLIIEWLPGTIPDREKRAGTTVYLPGQVKGPTMPSTPLSLALAFDGRIASVTRTFADRYERGMFQFLIPADRRPEPAAVVELLVVDSAGGQTVLRRCSWPRPQVSLENGPPIESR